MAEGDVVFRKIRGRIVPIRVKKSSPIGSSRKHAKITTEDSKQARALFGLGIGTSVAGSALGAGFFRKATKIRASSVKFKRITKLAASNSKLFAPEFVSDVAKKLKSNRIKSLKLLRAAKVSRFAGIAVGSALASAGIQKLIDKRRDVAGESAEQIASLAVGTAAAFAANKAFDLIGKTKAIRAALKLARTVP